METWKAGFKTTTACYEWAASSKYFNPAQFKTREPGFKKKKSDRSMYAGFFEWAGSLSQQQNPATFSGNGEVPGAREAALDYFGKRTELNERRAAERRKELLKQFFSGSCVRDWTGLGNYWLGVKKIMDGVRDKFDGEVNIAKCLEEEGAERLRSIVLEVQNKLGIFPLPINKAPRMEGKGVDKMKSGMVEIH